MAALVNFSWATVAVFSQSGAGGATQFGGGSWPIGRSS